MPDQDPNRIDPRYDAAFQRGFDGEVRSAPRSESALRRTAVVNPAPARRVPVASASAAVTAPGDRTAPESAALEPIVEHAVAERTPPERPAVAVVENTTAVETATPADVTRNPFYLVAAALAVLLIIGGAVWLDQGFSAIENDATTTSVGYYAAMVMGFGAPLAIGIGVAIIGGLLFVLARSWRPREAERREPERRESDRR